MKKENKDYKPATYIGAIFLVLIAIISNTDASDTLMEIKLAVMAILVIVTLNSLNKWKVE